MSAGYYYPAALLLGDSNILPTALFLDCNPLALGLLLMWRSEGYIAQLGFKKLRSA